MGNMDVEKEILDLKKRFDEFKEISTSNRISIREMKTDLGEIKEILTMMKSGAKIFYIVGNTIKWICAVGVAIFTLLHVVSSIRAGQTPILKLFN